MQRSRFPAPLSALLSLVPAQQHCCTHSLCALCLCSLKTGKTNSHPCRSSVALEELKAAHCCARGAHGETCMCFWSGIPALEVLWLGCIRGCRISGQQESEWVPILMLTALSPMGSRRTPSCLPLRAFHFTGCQAPLGCRVSICLLAAASVLVAPRSPVFPTCDVRHLGFWLQLCTALNTAGGTGGCGSGALRCGAVAAAP